MNVAITPRYGSADVLQIQQLAAPVPGPGEVLVRVHSSAVTAGDCRLREADFPGFTAVIGRMMFGFSGPRRPVQGTMFAGEVLAVGSAVTRYQVGDDVFGGVDQGAYAELLLVSEEGAMAHLPAGIDYDRGAATPYGAGTAFTFLRDLAKVQPGERVLLLGASGGVGRYAIQVGKHLGAHVTAVCSASTASLVRRLGADEVLDYRTTDFTQLGERYDVVLDLADASSFTHSRAVLTPKGRYLTLYASISALWHMATTAMLGGQRVIVGVAFGDREGTEAIAEALEQGVVEPVIASTFAFEDIASAHRSAEAADVHGDVLVHVHSQVDSQPRRRAQG